MPSSHARLAQCRTLFGYVALVLGGVLLGWNIAQFWSYANYLLVFAVNEALLCVCALSVYLFLRRPASKKGNNEESDKASGI